MSILEFFNLVMNYRFTAGGLGRFFYEAGSILIWPFLIFIFIGVFVPILDVWFVSRIKKREAEENERKTTAKDRL